MRAMSFINSKGRTYSPHGADWGRKKRNKDSRGSQTTGRTKGKACMCLPLDKHMAKTSRSYKHHEYASWCDKCDRKNKR